MKTRPDWAAKSKPILNMQWRIYFSGIRELYEAVAKDALSKYLVELMRVNSDSDMVFCYRLHEEWQEIGENWRTDQGTMLRWSAWIEVKHGKETD